jgi:hypothetical protein
MRLNRLYTITAGTPINVATGLTTAAAKENRLDVKRVFIQMAHDSAGASFDLGYVMDGIPYGRVPAAANASDITAELTPASTTQPGGNYSDSDNDAGMDAAKMWVDGLHTGDKIRVSLDVKV